MPVIRLTQSFIDNITDHMGDKLKDQFCDSETRGLLVDASKNGRANFYLRYKSTEGKTSYIPIGHTSEVTLADARKKAIELKAEIAKGANPREAELARQKDLTFTTFFEDYYMPYVRPRKRSWKKDQQMFDLRLKSEFGDLKLKELTKQQIQAFHTSLLDEMGLSEATANHHIKLVRHALNLAVEWDMLESNPVRKVALFEEDNKVENYLSDEQLQQLLHVLNTYKNRPVSLLCMYLLSTGARLNEALSSQWKHISIEAKVWRIPAENSKSKRVRSVPLNESAISVLHQLMTKDQYEYLFINPKTGKPFVNVHKPFNQIRELAGVPFLRIHDLRHMYASFLVNTGRTLYEVQQILGHSDSKVTQRYAHLSSKTLLEAANSASLKISEAMRSKSNVAENFLPEGVNGNTGGVLREAA